MEEAEILCDRLAIMDHGHILEMGTVDELISKRFKERAVRFDAIDGIADAELGGLAAVTSVKHDDDAVLLYTSDVAATVGALLALTEAHGVEPQNLGDPAGDARGRLPRPDRSSAARLTTGSDRCTPSSALTLANIRSYTRDRAAVFWTLAFPLVFIVLFGLIFQGSGGARLTLGWVDEDALGRRRSSCAPAFAALDGVTLVDTTLPRRRMADDAGRQGRLDHRRAGRLRRRRSRQARRAAARRPRSRSTPTRRGRSSRARVYQAIGSVLGIVNLGGRPPLVVPSPQTVQTENLNAISYFVPSMLGLSIMQVGIFAAIPLVADREKLILKRLAATPLRRWQLVGSNVLMRVLIAFTQAIIIVAVGSLLFGVEIIGSLLLVGGVRGPRRDGLPGARLRHRLVRQDRGRGQRDDQR